MPHGVGLMADDHVVTRACQRSQRSLVRHRTRGKPQRGFFAQQGGGTLLQSVDRWVLAELIIAYRGNGDFRAHLRRRACHGIGT